MLGGEEICDSSSSLARFNVQLDLQTKLIYVEPSFEESVCYNLHQADNIALIQIKI